MIVYLIISFFLENIIGLLFNNSNIMPLFFLVASVIIYQHYKVDDDKYLLFLFFAGIFYDIVYTNIYIDSFLYIVIGIINIIYVKNFNNNLGFNILFLILSLFIYELLYYLFFILLGLNNFNAVIFIINIIKILIPNIIYYLISFGILKKIRR